MRVIGAHLACDDTDNLNTLTRSGTVILKYVRASNHFGPRVGHLPQVKLSFRSRSITLMNTISTDLVSNISLVCASIAMFA